MTLLQPSGATAENVLTEGAFSDSDLAELNRAVRTAELASGASAAALLMPTGRGGLAARLTERVCRFDHCGVLLFPRTLEAGLAELRRLGLSPAPPMRSTVVCRRLSDRYGVTPPEVMIARLRVPLSDGRGYAAVEAFLFPRNQPSYHVALAESESAYGYERHTAYVVPDPDPAVLGRLIAAWRAEAGLVWEGGGHNPHEGSTVFYFVREPANPAPHRRFELHCTGDLRAFSERLPLDADAVERAYRNWRPSVPAA